MSLAREINEKLDEIIEYNKQLDAVNNDFKNPNFTLNDVNSGEQVTQEMVLNKATEVYDQIISDLNKLTNDGKNCRNIFSNQYYVNDMSEDRRIVEQERENKLKIEQAKQHGKNN
jgi:hypothetical protein|tara:strand:+ start:415 stop:759 length:345 start_codon:yes stop_codon:yes gene_type:complete